MTKPITSVAAMMLLEEGAFELSDPVSPFIPSFADMRVYAGGSDLKAVTVPVTGAGPDPAPAHPHLRAEVRVPPRAPSDALSGGRGTSWSFPEAVDLEQPSTSGPGAAALPARRGVELLAGDRRPRPGRRGRLGPSLDRFLAERILGPLGMTDTSFGVAGREPADSDWPASTPPLPPGGWSGRRRGRGVHPPGEPALRGRRPGVDRADYHRFLMMLRGGGELDGVRCSGRGRSPR